MNKTDETTMDVVSTFMAGYVLYLIDAPWWAYFLMLLFGTCQQIVGRNRGKTAILKQGLEFFILHKLKTAMEKKP